MGTHERPILSATPLPSAWRQAWRELAGLVIATGLAFVVLLSLGVWQLQRLAWKEALLVTIAERTAAAPQPPPPEEQWAALRPEDYIYRHVVLTGTFDHDKEVHVFRPLQDAKGPAHGIGDLVLTPLRLSSGAVVIVNRGFVPAERVDPTTRAAGQLTGLVTVTGLMRDPESRNAFTPADDPAKDEWFTRDPVAIAAAEHLDRVAPFTVDADASALPGGLPQGGETLLDIPNNHLSYAMTWFGLALGLAGVSAAYLWRILSVRRDEMVPHTMLVSSKIPTPDRMVPGLATSGDEAKGPSQSPR